MLQLPNRVKSCIIVLGLLERGKHFKILYCRLFYYLLPPPPPKKEEEVEKEMQKTIAKYDAMLSSDNFTFIEVVFTLSHNMRRTNASGHKKGEFMKIDADQEWVENAHLKKMFYQRI